MDTLKELVAKRKIDTLKTYMVLRADIIRDDVIQRQKTIKEDIRKNRIDKIRVQVIPKPGSSYNGKPLGQEGMHPFSIFSADVSCKVHFVIHFNA